MKLVSDKGKLIKSLVIAMLITLIFDVVSSTECGSRQREELRRDATLGTTQCSFNVSLYETISERVGDDGSNEGAEFYCFINDNFDAQCTSKCLNGSETCNGDSHYCRGHTCSDNLCYCQLLKLFSRTRVNCGDGSFTPDGFKNVSFCVETAFFELPTDTETMTISMSDVLDVEKSRTTYKLKLKPSSISKELRIFKRWSDIKISQSSKKRGLESSEQAVGEEMTIKSEPSDSSSWIEVPIDDEDVVIVGYFKGESDAVWVRSQMGAPDVTNDDFCYLGHCEYCESNSQWTGCQVSNFGYIKIALIISCLIVALCMLPWLVACCTMMSRCMRCMFGPACRCLCNCCSRKGKNNDSSEDKRNLVVQMDTMSEDSDDLFSDVVGPREMVTKSGVRYIETLPGTPETERRQSQTMLNGVVSNKPIDYSSSVKQYNAQPLFMFVLLFSFSIFPIVTGQCSTSIISSSQIKSCVVYNVSHSVCSFKPTVVYSLNGVGSTSCTVFTANNTVVGSMNITFNSLQINQALVKDYYTSCWQGMGESSKSCFLENCCTYNSYGDCSQWNPYNDPNPCSKFSSSIMSYPGASACYSGCGCAGCGCFSCANSCMYNRFSLRPTGDVGIVNSFGLQTIAAGVRVKLNMKTTLDTTITSTTPIYSGTQLTATFQGVFIDFAVNFGGKKLLTNSEGARFVDAATANIPSSNVIGDIQSDSSSGLTNPTSSSFKYPTDIVSKSYTQTTTVFQFKPCGYQYKSSYSLLPTSSSGFSWYYDSTKNQIYALVNRFLSAQITISMNQNIDFYQLDDVVCPNVQFVSSAGCYQCTDGANVIVKIKSDCMEGTCILRFDQNITMVTNSVYLSKDWTTFNLTYLSGVKDVNANLIVDCGRNRAQTLVKASLVDKSTIYENKNDTIIVAPNVQGTTDLGGLLGIGQEASDAILAIIIIIGAVLLLLLVVFLIYKCWPQTHKGEEITFGRAFLMATGIHSTMKSIERNNMEKKYKKLQETQEETQTPDGQQTM